MPKMTEAQIMLFLEEKEYETEKIGGRGRIYLRIRKKGTILFFLSSKRGISGPLDLYCPDEKRLDEADGLAKRLGEEFEVKVKVIEPHKK